MMRKTMCFVSLVMVVTAWCAAAEDATPVPLERAHAHNDYMHKRPLLDALDCGFCSVEADIYLVDGALLVAHELKQCKPEGTLQALYLDPLHERVVKNGGRVFPGGPVETLLIDLKSNGEATYAALDKVLAGYADMLTEYEGDKVTERAVTVVISGNCPNAMIEGQARRFAAIDGRPADLDRNPPKNMVPLISDSWGSQFKWRGRGEMPEAEQAKLADLVKRAHEQGRRIRFWGLPWTQAMWPMLYDAGVDLINADDLTGLQTFLLEKIAPKP